MVHLPAHIVPEKKGHRIQRAPETHKSSLSEGAQNRPSSFLLACHELELSHRITPSHREGGKPSPSDDKENLFWGVTAQVCYAWNARVQPDWGSCSGSRPNFSSSGKHFSQTTEKPCVPEDHSHQTWWTTGEATVSGRSRTSKDQCGGDLSSDLTCLVTSSPRTQEESQASDCPDRKSVV